MKKRWKILCLLLLACSLLYLHNQYHLTTEEILSWQISRLARVWLPNRLVNTMPHVCSVCADVFRQFIVGQTTEAVILGSLCGLCIAEGSNCKSGSSNSLI